MSKTDSLSPTEETYSAFQHYYDVFNEIFFNNTLPQCLITYQRGSGFEAYYMHRAFRKGDNVTDEIAMNPEAFIGRSKDEVLATFLHEIVHLNQFSFGSPSRGGYHNREWASMMEKVGLQPFGVGRNNYGKRTGQEMNHKIIPGGVFDEFLKNDSSNHFEMWVQRYSKIISREDRQKDIEHILEILGEEPDVPKELKKQLETLKDTIAGFYIDTADKIKEINKRSGSKSKYKCDCGNNVWGKDGLKLLCLECQSFFLYDL